MATAAAEVNAQPCTVDPQCCKNLSDLKQQEAEHGMAHHGMARPFTPQVCIALPRPRAHLIVEALSVRSRRPRRSPGHAPGHVPHLQCCPHTGTSRAPRAVLERGPFVKSGGTG